MDLRVEIMKNILLESFREWLEKNKDVIGEKWYAKLRKELDRAESRINSEVDLIGYAFWMYGIISNFAVKTHISRKAVTLHSKPPTIDEKSTKQLLTAIQMSIW